MLLLAAPGQGAQAPGFLGEWLELPGVAGRLGALSELAGCDLIRCGTTADAEEIRDTAIAQPLLVAAAVTAAAELLGGAGRANELADAAPAPAWVSWPPGRSPARCRPRTRCAWCGCAARPWPRRLRPSPPG